MQMRDILGQLHLEMTPHGASAIQISITGQQRSCSCGAVEMHVVDQPLLRPYLGVRAWNELVEEVRRRYQVVDAIALAALDAHIGLALKLLLPQVLEHRAHLLPNALCLSL